MADPTQFPAIVEPATQEHHIGKVIFEELVTPDIASAKKFYTGLFGWTFRDIPLGESEYAEAFVNDRPVAGLIQKRVPTGEQHQPTWRSFFAVSDVDSAVHTAQQNGAKVLFEPHTLPGRGREAVLADPQGAVFAILASSSGDTPDDLAEPGEWIWSSLHTNDPDHGVAFYQNLFDYEVFELPADKDHAQHLLMASESYARASANSLAGDGKNAHPHWINYVRVDDAVAMTAKVKALGGRVLVAPHMDRHGGQIAIVADPQGAPFGLMEWSDTDSKEVSQ